MKNLSFIILPLIFISCSEKNINTPTDPLSTTVKIPFKTIIHDRLFFLEEPAIPLVVLHSLEEQQLFLDTTETGSKNFNFSSYDDSLLIVLISPHEISVSNDFTIDSLVADTARNVLTVYAHNFFPVGKMSIPSIHCHVVGIPKTETDIMLSISDIFETTTGTVIAFTSFLPKGGEFRYFSDLPLLVTLNSHAAQDSFLNEINFSASFPLFNYTDSMLVGVLSQQFNHYTEFEIVSIIQFDNIIKVKTQYYYSGMLPSVEGSYHFVSIQKFALPFVLESNIGVNPWYD